MSLKGVIHSIHKYKLVEGGRIDKDGCGKYRVPVEKVREVVFEGMI